MLIVVICFFIRLFNKLKTEMRIFKKRRQMGIKYYNLFSFKRLAGTFLASAINFNLCKCCTSRETRFELIQFAFFKRCFKRISRKPLSYQHFSKKIFWVYWKANYPLTRKSKNSRMGKGKGAFSRWALRVPSHFLLFKFYLFVPATRINKILKFLNYKLGYPMYFIY